MLEKQQQAQLKVPLLRRMQLSFHLEGWQIDQSREVTASIKISN